MSKVSEIKDRIREAKILMDAQKREADESRRVWHEKLDKELETQRLIYELYDELRQAKMECYDEDGMYIGEQV